MNSLRILKFLLPLLLAVCFGTSANAMPGSAATAADKDLLVIGVLDDYPIFYANQDGEPSGLAVDLLTQFARTHGYTLTFELYPSSQIDAVFRQKGDLRYNISRLDEETAPQSTLPFYYKNYVLYAHSGSLSASASFSELKKRLATFQDNSVIGYKGNLVDRAYLKEKLDILNYKQFESNTKLLSALDNHALSFALIPDALAEKLRKEQGFGTIRQISATLFIEESSFVLAPERADLMYDLNHYIKEIRMDERLNGFISKWFTYQASPLSVSPYILYFNLFALFAIFVVLLLSYKNNAMKRIIEAKTGELVAQNQVNQGLYAELLQKEQYKNTYFINLSHELRTPISVILNAVQMIEISGKASAQSKIEKYSQVIQDNSYRLLRVISNLIDVHRLESNNFKLRLEPIPLMQLFRQLDHELIEMGYWDEGSLSVAPMAEDLLVYADRYELFRIFVNLMSNSVKFTEEAAKIRIWTAVETDQADKADRVIIYYKDNSSGISADMRASLFSGFYFETALPVKKSEGRGLGLYLVREMMTLHGGDIVLCDDSQAYTYKLTLPAPPQQVTSASSPSPSIDLRQLIRMEFAEVTPHPTLKKASSAD